MYSCLVELFEKDNQQTWNAVMPSIYSMPNPIAISKLEIHMKEFANKIFLCENREQSTE